jgi:hypothetical protein
MSDQEDNERFSLSRWSRLKREAEAAPPETATAAEVPATLPAAVPAQPELPPVESLTIDSDFKAFMQPEVDADLRRAAVKQLFRSPQFNVMDGLDTYIDDYSKPDPIPPDMLARLQQVTRELEGWSDAGVPPATIPTATNIAPEDAPADHGVASAPATTDPETTDSHDS